MGPSSVLPEDLKQKIAQQIVDNFVKDDDVADALMGLAAELTEVVINSKSGDLFSEISGMVGWKLAELVQRGYNPVNKQEQWLPDKFNADVARRVVQEGDHDLLKDAFIFDSTAEGEDYWNLRQEGKSELDSSDFYILKKWIRIAEAQQKEVM